MQLQINLNSYDENKLLSEMQIYTVFAYRDGDDIILNPIKIDSNIFNVVNSPSALANNIVLHTNLTILNIGDIERFDCKNKNTEFLLSAHTIYFESETCKRETMKGTFHVECINSLDNKYNQFDVILYILRYKDVYKITHVHPLDAPMFFHENSGITLDIPIHTSLETLTQLIEKSEESFIDNTD